MRASPYILICITLITLSMSGGGGHYPAHDFVSPVHHPLKLSGTFGELRSNHFHAGLDIRSERGIAGDPVLAALDGFVSRIKVEEYGYGNALYIEHPNGFTTVYAHLKSFSPEIAAYVKKEQYKQKSFEVNIYPKRGQFAFEKSQQIGTMGNTGSSGGAHLHFEIRHTEGQVPVNPLHFGFAIGDSKYPVIEELLVYEYDAKGILLRTNEVHPNYISKGQYVINQPLDISTAKVAFGVRAYDSQNGSTNRNGIYSLTCKVDDEPTFAFQLDEISFQKSRYLNAHIDYDKKVSEGRYYHRCHPLEGNKLSIYTLGKEKGYIYVNPDSSRHIDLTIADFMNNTSTLSFEIKRSFDTPIPETAPAKYQMVAEFDQVNVLSIDGLQVVWPKGSFYEQTKVDVHQEDPDPTQSLSPYFTLLPRGAAVHHYFDINIEGLSVPKYLLDKALIARCDPEEDCVSCGGDWIGNNLTASVRQMSRYTIMVDTVPPSIRPIHFGPRMSGWKRMAFKITDNFEMRDRGRDLRYKGYVDGEWILFELDGKTGMLTHHFDGRIPPGDHTLTLKVTDDRNNESVFEKSFTL